MNTTNRKVIEIQLLYKDFSQYFVWSTRDTMWTQRKQGNVIGHIVTCHPREGERYYFRLLLMNMKVPKSYEDLCIVNGTCYNTLRAVAENKGLLACDNN